MEAIQGDGGKAIGEVHVTEIATAHNDITHALNNLEIWARGTVVSNPLTDWVLEPTVATLKRASLIPEPVGVVVIIGAWNYPLILLLRGLVAALAAGNTIILKPSELAPRTATLLANLIPDYFREGAVGVVNGGGSHETAELLRFKVHHILYTGSHRGGQAVLEAASRFMTPVTLELGGKCPVVVDGGFSKAQLQKVARKILWAKCLNAGQTCIAPDYVLVREDTKYALLGALQEAYGELYGGNAAAVSVSNPPSASNPNAHYSRIANWNQYKRLVRLLRTPDNGEIAFGGRCDEGQMFIEPTVLHNVPANAPILREEIFGPILPVITFTSPADIISMIGGGPWGQLEPVNGAYASPTRGASLSALHRSALTHLPMVRSGVPMTSSPSSSPSNGRASLREPISPGHGLETPLAAYIFSPSDDFVQSIVPHLHVGGVTINDIMLHAAHPKLPFGGVGNSGMGRYSGGYHGFERFSHWKPVAEAYLVGPTLIKLFSFIPLTNRLAALRFPPYTPRKRATIARATQRRVHGSLERTLWRLWAEWSYVLVLLMGVIMGLVLGELQRRWNSGYV